MIVIAYVLDTREGLIQQASFHTLKSQLRGVANINSSHGNLDEESYCFLHGLPTRHTGSWDPHLATPSCGSERCASLPLLWEAELYNGKLGDANWRRRRSQECDTCAAERKRRCRVLDSSDLSPILEDDVRFADAPYIHAFNEPKYHASQIRALHFARAKKSIVLWCFAVDRPLTQHTDLLGERQDINERRKQWSRYHEMNTAGIMGLQPLVHDMPLRITQTDHDRKDKGFFKNNRCRLFGWELKPEDENYYARCTAQEMVLQDLPVSPPFLPTVRPSLRSTVRPTDLKYKLIVGRRPSFPPSVRPSFRTCVRLTDQSISISVYI